MSGEVRAAPVVRSCLVAGSLVYFLVVLCASGLALFHKGRCQSLTPSLARCLVKLGLMTILSS